MYCPWRHPKYTPFAMDLPSRLITHFLSDWATQALHQGRMELWSDGQRFPELYDVIKWRQSQEQWLHDLTLTLVATQLLGTYLQNRMVDFAHFLQANWYGQVDITYKNSLPSGQYLSL